MWDWETKDVEAGRWGSSGGAGEGGGGAGGGGFGQGRYLSSWLAWRMPSGRRQRATDIPAGLGTVLGIQQVFKPHTPPGIPVICVT